MGNVNLNIKSFGDYRSFLNAYYAYKQNQNDIWSYGLWAKMLNLKATSSLTKIINGEREPGSEITHKFIDYFKFDSHEAMYFADLIRISKTKDDVRLRCLLLEKMGREYPDARLKVIDDKSFNIISNWFCLTIREIVKLHNFIEDPVWIQNRLRFEVTIDEIRQAIKDLLHQGLLKRNEDGKLVQSEGLLHTANDEASKAIQKYHVQMLDNAKNSLGNVDVLKREFTAETLTMNASRIMEAKELIRDFKAKFARLFEENQGDVTYQIQIQLFPLTQEFPSEE